MHAWNSIAVAVVGVAIAGLTAGCAMFGGAGDADAQAVLVLDAVAAGEGTADVMLDGVAYGQCSVVLLQSLYIEAEPGMHVLRVEAGGHMPFEETVEFKAGDTQWLTVELTPSE